MVLDASHLAFSGSIQTQPSTAISFTAALDGIDLDRYLPAPAGKSPGQKQKAQGKPPSAAVATARAVMPDCDMPATGYPSLSLVMPGRRGDAMAIGAGAVAYAAVNPPATPGAQKGVDWKRLDVTGNLQVGRLQAKGMQFQDLSLKVSGGDGQWHVDPFTVRLYQGSLAGGTRLDMRQDPLSNTLTLKASQVQVGQLLRDLGKKEVLDGTMQGQVVLVMNGAEADRIKRSLNGKGEILVRDGVLKGIDLAEMARSVSASLGLERGSGRNLQTTFTELRIPFTVHEGVVETQQAVITSPLLTVTAQGKADLVHEVLDLRLRPVSLNIRAGRRNILERAGVTIPLRVTGPFSSPQVRPEIEGMLPTELGGKPPEPSALKELPPGQEKRPGSSQELKDKARELLKKLPFGK
jgi:AsmA protein